MPAYEIALKDGENYENYRLKWILAPDFEAIKKYIKKYKIELHPEMSNPSLVNGWTALHMDALDGVVNSDGVLLLQKA